MLQFIVKKTLNALAVLLGVATLVFFLFTVVPGDPAQMMMGKREDPELLASIKAKYGLDKPLWKQYVNYLGRLSPIGWESGPTLKWPDLGESYTQQGTSVGSLVASTFPNTAFLAFLAIALAFVIGVALGGVIAHSPDALWARWVSSLSSIGMSIPSFFSAVIVAWVFAYLLGPWTGFNLTGSLTAIDDYTGERYMALKNAVLPALTLGIRPVGVITQLTKNSALNVMGQDYIKLAKAKGLGTRYIFFKHVLPNAMNPIITAVSGWFASLLAGAVFVEYIFGWNGMGKLLVDALNTQDMPVTMGCVLLIAAVFVIINTLVDMAYSVLDPRVRSKMMS